MGEWYKKITWWHVGVLIALPIILALINPNWLFNASAWDDYFYTGYMLELPRFVGWESSDNHYLIERVAWTMPNYVLHQRFSPVIANIISHLIVYYVALFAFYGLVTRLFNPRAGLFGAVMLGQFSLFLRATGWDYPDGYTIALMTVCFLLMTYATQAPMLRARWYFIGAGIVAMTMLLSQTFYGFYLAFVGVYALVMNWRHQRHSIVRLVGYSFVGALLAFIVWTLLYNRLTGKWFILENAIRIASSSIENWAELIQNVYSRTIATWHIAFIPILLMGLIAVLLPHRARGIYGENTPHFRLHLRLCVGFLAWCYLILIAWALRGSDYYRVSYYNTLLAPSVFMVVAGLFAGRLYRLQEAQFRVVMMFACVMPMLFFIIYSQLSNIQWLLMAIIALIGGVIMFPIATMMRRGRSLAYAIIALSLLSYLSGLDPYYINIFNPDRYSNQRVYDVATSTRDYMRERYKIYHTDDFRIWYLQEEGGNRLIRATVSLYSGDRRIRPMSDVSDEPRWDEKLYRTKEIILLTNEYSPQEMVARGDAILNPLGYRLDVLDQITIERIGLRLSMIITRVVPHDG